MIVSVSSSSEGESNTRRSHPIRFYSLTDYSAMLYQLSYRRDSLPMSLHVLRLIYGISKSRSTIPVPALDRLPHIIDALTPRVLSVST